MIKNDLAVDHLFAFIDKDRSNSVTIEELTRGLCPDIITPDECVALFMSIDQDGNKVLTYEELVLGLSKIHASYCLHKIRMAL